MILSARLFCLTWAATARTGPPRPMNGSPMGSPVARSLWGARTRPLALTWASMRSAGIRLMRAAEDWAVLDLLLGEVGDGFVGPEWAELAAAMGCRPL